MKTKRTLTIATGLLALVVLLTLGLFRGSRQVNAQDQIPPPVPDRIAFGSVGITQGQTARLNVTNISTAVCPCQRVVLTFRGSSGQLLQNQQGEVIRRSVELQPGESTFLDVDYDALPPGPTLPPGPSRLQLRAGITFLPPSPIDDSQVRLHLNERQVPPPMIDTVISTVEVINNADSRTQFVVTNPAVLRGFNPQPDPPR